MKNKPILFLDVDGVLISWSSVDGPHPPTNVKEFFEWATETFEVRWLTCWCPVGWLETGNSFSGARGLSMITKIPQKELLKIRNPTPWRSLKTESIDFSEKRMWFWIEDEILKEEKDVLEQHGMLDRFILTDTSTDVNALIETQKLLTQRLNNL